MILKDVGELIMKHEGFSNKPYICTAGRQTIGYGRNISDKGITEAEAKHLLVNDINECYQDLKNIFDRFKDLSENRQSALIDMRYNLGSGGFRKFKKMIAAIKENDFKKASEEMKASLWFYQVKRRGETLYNMMKAG